LIRSLIPCFVLVLLSSPWLYSQGETKELDSVTITEKQLLSRETSIAITKIRIERALATDIGQLMTLFTGVQVRSYGGLGGMKTVSFRSLGAGHTSVVYDHFALSQTQSGQTDVGQIPVDFVNRLQLISQAGTSLDYPIHAKVAGQIIAIETRHSPLRKSDFQLNVGGQIGSFGQLDAHTFMSKQFSKWKIAASFKGRRFDGTYPFSYQNGATLIQTKRTNGDLTEFFGTGSISYYINPKNTLHATYTGTYYDKGLPGAVVFYNETGTQRLYGTNHLVTLRHLIAGKQIDAATTASFQQNSLDYIDSNYLNNLGYLHSHFLSQQSDAQTQVRFRSKNDSLHVLLGSGIRYEQLFSASFNQVPKRFSIDGIAAVQLNWFGLFSAQIGLQSISDLRPSSTKQLFVLLPSIEWKKVIYKQFTFSTAYRYTVRQPSFNELYYNQVGNENLRPEKAHLFNFQLANSIQFGKGKQWDYDITLQPFYVFATDKILAIPTKNLFVWSIQNIGKSQAFGTEFRQKIAARFGPNRISLLLNYTFQYTEDISNSTSPTYGHILSYSPLHAGTSELNYDFKRFGASVLLTYQGERYALNQNIPANLLDDFFLIDFSLSYRFNLKKHQLVTRLAVKNITNNYYSYIRYFVMPGTNFTLRLSYDF